MSKTKRNAHHGIWRKRQIILSPEVVQELFSWHGGQFTPTYALASTGMENLVSASMIDAAVLELEGIKLGRGKAKLRKERNALLGELDGIRTFWREHSAQEAGMDISEREYEYDNADYGLSAEDEEQLDRQMVVRG